MGIVKLFVFWFKLKGWKIKGEFPADIKKCVLLAAPHTSNWDFVYALAALDMMKKKVSFLAKKELFRFPLKGFLLRSGGIPVDRSKNNNLVDQLAELLREKKELFLIVPPEGTRSAVKKWKTGFYHSALKGGAPIVLTYLDYSKKVAGVGTVIYPSGQLEQDFQKIKEFYMQIAPKFPDKFNPEAII
jgi:1-acyl-sn-glycerol-3-phosphate acyltransferase